jgi:hypothetical protein
MLSRSKSRVGYWLKDMAFEQICSTVLQNNRVARSGSGVWSRLQIGWGGEDRRSVVFYFLRGSFFHDRWTSDIPVVNK